MNCRKNLQKLTDTTVACSLIVVKPMKSILWVILCFIIALPARSAPCPQSENSSCCCAGRVEIPDACCATEAKQTPPVPTCSCEIQNPILPGELPTTQSDLRGKNGGIDFNLHLRAFCSETPRSSFDLIDPCADGPPPAPPRFILLCSLLR